MKLESGHILQNRYRVVREIEPELYRAWDSSLEQPRVLRVLPNAAASNRPIQLTQLHHAHLTRINDVVPIDTARVLVMDYVDGQSINERVVERGQPLNLERVQRWANQIGDGLRHLHGRGITHGAVSADSIRITPSADAMLTNYAVNGGTTADDVRGLATAMYTMVTGQKPSKTAPNQINTAVSPAMNSAIVNGMNGRFNTVDDFLSALDKLTTPAATNNDKTTVLDGAKQSAPQDKTTLLDTPSATYQSTTPAKSSKKGFPLLPLLGGIFAVLALGAGAFFMMNQDGADNPVEATNEPIDAVVETPPAESQEPEEGQPTEEPDAEPDEEPDEESPTEIPTAPSLAVDTPIPTPAPLDPTADVSPPVTIGSVTYQQMMALPLIDDEGNKIRTTEIDMLVLDDENSTLYVLLSGDVILVLDLNTGEERRIEPFTMVDGISTLRFPVDEMALYNDGQLLVGSTQSGVVVIDASTGEAIQQFGLRDNQVEDDESNIDMVIDDVNGLVMDKDGNIVVLTEFYEDSVFTTFIKVFAPDGSLVRNEQLPFEIEEHLAIDGNGNVVALQVKDEAGEDMINFLRLNTTGDGDFIIDRFGQDAMEGLYSSSVKQFAATDDGSVLYGTYSAALFLLDKEGTLITTLSEAESCFEDDFKLQSYQTCDVRAVTISGDGNTVFFGTNVDTLSYLVQITR